MSPLVKISELNTYRAISKSFKFGRHAEELSDLVGSCTLSAVPLLFSLRQDVQVMPRAAVWNERPQLDHIDHLFVVSRQLLGQGWSFFVPV